ncbi:Bifunctional epoxide hydrolase 2 [Linum perenne]
MDQIKHKFVEVNGSNLHLAEIGAGDKVVVCLHGFPEIWYSWRHQMIALASAGFRVIAPDHRGYGLSDPSLEPEKTKFADLIADLRSILDFLNIPKVAVVAKDFGVLPGYYFALLYPERVLGVVTLGVPFVPPGSIQYHKHLPEGFYFTRWKEPGRAEADFSRFDSKTVVRKIYTMFSKSEVPIASQEQEVLDLVDTLTTPLPAWFTEEDLETYGSLYEKSGFRTALQVPYRSFDEEYEMESLEVKVPAMLIAGEKDYVLNFPGMEDYIRSGKVKDFVPELATVFLPEGTHFVQEQLPEQVNQLILKFLDTKIVWS